MYDTFIAHLLLEHLHHIYTYNLCIFSSLCLFPCIFTCLLFKFCTGIFHILPYCVHNMVLHLYCMFQVCFMYIIHPSMICILCKFSFMFSFILHTSILLTWCIFQVWCIYYCLFTKLQLQYIMGSNDLWKLCQAHLPGQKAVSFGYLNNDHASLSDWFLAHLKQLYDTLAM